MRREERRIHIRAPGMAADWPRLIGERQHIIEKIKVQACDLFDCTPDMVYVDDNEPGLFVYWVDGLTPVRSTCHGTPKDPSGPPRT